MISGVIQKSLSWSLFAEVSAKLIVPVSTMILARLLVPEDFGVLAICNMVVSFADIITDAGFGKYLIQHDFNDDDEKIKSANVAFWSNFSLSVLAFLIVFVNRRSLAELLGNSAYSNVIVVSSIQLIFTSLSSIQTSLLRRNFDYKKLFFVRIVVSLLPLVVAVPVALLTKSYWALILGNLSGTIGCAILLTIISDWKPKMFYSFQLLKKMFGFSFWSLCEGVGHWTIFWIDTFIVSKFFSEYYVGIYKNSANVVMSLFGIVSASMSPVLLSSLSRLKNDKNDFFGLFIALQRFLSYVVIPMGIGLYFFRDLATMVMFGSQWTEASNVIGAWGLMMMVSVLFYTFVAEIYKSRGVPKILFLSQILYLLFLLPVCCVSANYGFWTMVYARCLCVFFQVVINVLILKFYFSYNSLNMFSNILKPLMASIVIVILGMLANYNNSIEYQLFLLLVTVVIYFVVLYVWFKNDILAIWNKIHNYKIINE